jgi:iron complex outermembrane receptor protein
VQFLQDGLSLFDPCQHATITRQQPMELIKRVEMITGPGGVLWGSNSLLGILNVITKDAEDVEGVEVGSRSVTARRSPDGARVPDGGQSELLERQAQAVRARQRRDVSGGRVQDAAAVVSQRLAAAELGEYVWPADADRESSSR